MEAFPRYTTDPAEAFGLLREMVDKHAQGGDDARLSRSRNDRFILWGDRLGWHEADTLETAIALAWLSVFGGAEQQR
jgi:hypothetical protein